MLRGVHFPLKFDFCKQPCGWWACGHGPPWPCVSLVQETVDSRSLSWTRCINRIRNERLSVPPKPSTAAWHHWAVWALGWDWLVFDYWLCCLPDFGPHNCPPNPCFLFLRNRGCQPPHPIRSQTGNHRMGSSVYRFVRSQSKSTLVKAADKPSSPALAFLSVLHVSLGNAFSWEK